MNGANSGVQITGGKVKIDNLVNGPKGQIIALAGGGLDNPERREIASLLAALTDALSRHHEQLRQPDKATVHAAEVARELSAPEPSGSRIRTLLSALATSAGPISAVTDAIGSLLSGIGALSAGPG